MTRIPDGTPVEATFHSSVNDEGGLPLFAGGTFAGTVVTYAPELGGYVVVLENGEQWTVPETDIKVK